MPSTEDPLELLLPRADATALRKARELTQFLRLFVMDAKSPTGTRVGLDHTRASAELEASQRARVEAALLDLARHYLEHACGADAWFRFGAPRHSVADAWSVLSEHGLELELPGLYPTPGEGPVEFARRALQLAEQLSALPSSYELWRARLERAQWGPKRALLAFEQGARSRSKATSAEQSAWIAGWAECLLERGAVREARALLAEHSAQLATDSRLRCLAAWTLVLMGEGAQAAELYAGVKPEEIALPRALAQLRTQEESFLPYLPGREVTTAELVIAPDAERSRSHLGACVCLEYSIAEDGQAELMHSELAPALRLRLPDWVEEHPCAHQEYGSLEQRCILEDRVIIRHRPQNRALAEALGSESTRAIAIVPVHGEQGKPSGWLRLEFEHHLVPRAEYLLAWAERAARPRLLAPSTLRVRPYAELEAEVFQSLVAQAELEGAQRRWWGFVLQAGRPELVCGSVDAEGGLGSGLSEGSCLQRALDAGGHVRIEEAQPGQALHPETQSGWVLCLRFAERTVGLLVLESSRRRDYSRLDPQALEALCTSSALQLKVAAFREQQREWQRAEAYYDAQAPGFARFAARLLRAAASEHCITLCGPLGSGRKTLTRWVHAQSARAEQDWVLCGPHSTWDLSRGGTLVCAEVERWSREAQLRLAEWLESRERGDPSRGPRPIVVLGCTPHEAQAKGQIDPELARRLERMCWRVPALRERRAELLGLFDALLQSLARREQLRAPVLEDSALALLWRQPWSGNLTELESVALRCLLFAPGRRLDEAGLERLMRDFGLRTLARLPSRHPERADLCAALRVTRLGTGRINKTRAAQYLGWDPDTLVARMQDLKLSADGPWEDSAWGGLEPPELDVATHE